MKKADRPSATKRLLSAVQEIDRLRADRLRMGFALREIGQVLDGAHLDIDMAQHHGKCEKGECVCGIGRMRSIVERAVGGES